jgi:ribosomal protein S18 acetylase RimI-like enzyme
MKDLRIRTMSRDDADAILAIDQKITGKKRKAFWLTRVAYGIARDPGASLVAEVDGKVVGFVLCDLRGGGFAPTEDGWIEILGVEPDYQRKGIGKLLCEEAIKHFKEKGVQRVRVSFSWTAADIAALMKSLGFRRAECITLEKELS